MQLSDAKKSEPGWMEVTPRTYRFKTTTNEVSATLNAEFFAVNTTRYTHWQDFKQDVNLIQSAVQAIYQPAYATRIGLRFVNRFTPGNTGSQSLEEMLGIFRKELTGLVSTEAWDEAFELVTQAVLPGSNGKLGLRTRYGRDETGHFSLLDLDYFEEGQLALNTLMKRLDRYHEQLYDAFRWCINEESIQRFHPIADGGGL